MNRRRVLAVVPALAAVVALGWVSSPPSRAATPSQPQLDPLVQQAELTAAGGAGGDELGFSVTVSGQTIVVGAPQANGGAGAVYVFTEPAAGWGSVTQTATLTASDAAAGDLLGTSVAIEGQTIVAGAPGFPHNAGAVYVFTEPSSGWTTTTQTAKLTASDGATGEDVLGSSVAIDGQTIVAGDDGHEIGGHTFQGAAYVFIEATTGWTDHTQSAELRASDGAAGDFLGTSVAVAGQTVVAGAVDAPTGAHNGLGAVYVFTEPATGWKDGVQTAELIASDGDYMTDPNSLGTSVAISATGDAIAAGAPQHAVSNGTSLVGAVYAFTEPTGGWSDGVHAAELTASDGANGDQLGDSVAFSGTTVVAGAPDRAVSGQTQAGSIYRFGEPADGWKDTTQSDELTATDGVSGDKLGTAVALDGDTLVAGAPDRAVGGNSSQGAAYVFGLQGAAGGSGGGGTTGSGTGTGTGGSGTGTGSKTRLHATISKARIDRRRHQATFTFHAPGASRYQCALVRTTKHSKARFAACRSPMTYKHLKPGRYIFDVRPVGAGTTKTSKRVTV